MAMSRVATGDIIRQAGRKLDLRDRNISSEEVAALATVISSSSRLEILSLYNVKLKSDVSALAGNRCQIPRMDAASPLLSESIMRHLIL